jgi:hypothetical protein
MSGDLVPLAAQAMPYMTAAAGAYGTAVLVKAKGEAADATVNLGRRLLQRIFGTENKGDRLPEPLQDLIANPEDPDVAAALRLQIRKLLAADPKLEAEIRSMLVPVGTSITASGERSIAAHTISGTASTGDNAAIDS